jgi:hypothetical protein
VRVVAGLSETRIIVPAGTHARVEVTGGLHDVDTQGSWSASGDTYETGSSGSPRPPAPPPAPPALRPCG